MPPIALPPPSIVLCLIVAFVLAGELFLRRWIEDAGFAVDGAKNEGEQSDWTHANRLLRLRWWFRTFVLGVFVGFSMAVDVAKPIHTWVDRQGDCSGYDTHYESWLVWADRSASLYADARTRIETKLATAVPCITF